MNSDPKRIYFPDDCPSTYLRGMRVPQRKQIRKALASRAAWLDTKIRTSKNPYYPQELAAIVFAVSCFERDSTALQEARERIFELRGKIDALHSENQELRSRDGETMFVVFDRKQEVRGVFSSKSKATKYVKRLVRSYGQSRKLEAEYEIRKVDLNATIVPTDHSKACGP